ncbi:hypothetical protein MMC18_004156 [Xylographa bjoerkii]|nr:hypothetical protein [Xylographa bjoerkii]
MDIDLPLSYAPFTYPPQSSQTTAQSSSGAASTAMVDYADEFHNPQPVQIKTEPYYDNAPAGPVYEATSTANQQPSLSWTPYQPVKLTGTRDAELLAYLARRRISPQHLVVIDTHIAAEVRWLGGAISRSAEVPWTEEEAQNPPYRLNAIQTEALHIYATGTPLQVYQLGAATFKEPAGYEDGVLDPNVKIPDLDLRRGIGLLLKLADRYWTIQPEDFEDYDELRAFMKIHNIPQERLEDIRMTVDENNRYLAWKKDVGAGSKDTRCRRMLMSLCQNGNPVDVVKWAIYHLQDGLSTGQQDVGLWIGQTREAGTSDAAVRNVLARELLSRGNQSDLHTSHGRDKPNKQEDSWRPSYDDDCRDRGRSEAQPITRDSTRANNTEAVIISSDRSNISLQNAPRAPKACRQGVRTRRRHQRKIALREEQELEKRKAEQILIDFPHQEVGIQDCFARLTVNENNHPGHLSVHRDRSDHLLQAAAATPVKTEKLAVKSGITNRSDITAISFRLNDSRRTHPDIPEQLPDKAFWDLLKAQALKNRPQAGNSVHQRRHGKKSRQLVDLPKRLADTEKQITTLRHSGPSTTYLEKKITNLTREALSVRVRIEEGEGRLTAEEAKALRRANARNLSRKTKQTDHERVVETLVEQVAMLL